jgi:hypothetical protein
MPLDVDLDDVYALEPPGGHERASRVCVGTHSSRVFSTAGSKNSPKVLWPEFHSQTIFNATSPESCWRPPGGNGRSGDR